MWTDNLSPRWQYSEYRSAAGLTAVIGRWLGGAVMLCRFYILPQGRRFREFPQAERAELCLRAVLYSKGSEQSRANSKARTVP
jgi:hypothetical protein